MSSDPGFLSTTVADRRLPRARRETVRRERVSALLDRALEQPLTVVCAPAGYGKTVALADWCRGWGGACVWLSLDDKDNDPRRFCARLLAAIDDLSPSEMWMAEHALAGGSDLFETVIPLAVAALGDGRGDDGAVIVLDDYQAITEDACHQLATALLDALPPGVHLVVASRTRPPLRLPRRRAAGAVAALDAGELAFDLHEAERLLNGRMRLRLEPGQVEAIHARVEGWPAGLSLVASLGEASALERFLETPEGTPFEIAEYLTEEVLDALPARTRAFLRRTAPLTRMNGALCAAVLDDPAARELFDEVRESNVFVVPIDDDWVRYHRLFATLLERDLRRHEPAGVAELHRRAASWFEREGMVEAAIDHATAAGDGERAARLLHDSWWPLFAERRYATIRRTVARMPRDRGRFGPFCAAVDALCLSLTGGDLRLIATQLERFEQDRDRPGVAEIVDLLRISPYYGDVESALADGWKIWSRAAGDVPARARQAGKLAVVMWFAGEREAIRREVEPYMRIADRPVVRSWELAALALTAADENDLATAEQHAREAVAVIEAAGGESSLESHLAHLALGEALRRRGRFAEAHVQVARALRITSRHPGTLYHALALVLQAQLDLSTLDRRAARSRATAARRIVDRFRDVGVLAERLAAVEDALDLPTHEAAGGSEPTAAERRVLALLPSDLTRRQIAVELGLSVATVKSHTWRLYRRLGAGNRADAVAIARERGLV